MFLIRLSDKILLEPVINLKMTLSLVNYAAYYRHNIYMLKLLGFWKPDNNMKYKNLYNLYTTICITVWVVFLASQLKVIYENVDDVVELTGLMYVNGKYVRVIGIQKIFPHSYENKKNKNKFG